MINIKNISLLIFTITLLTCTKKIDTPQSINIDGEASIEEVQALMANGKLTSLQLVEYYLNRINTYDSITHAVVIVNPDARILAKQMDEERAQGRLRGPLHGVPILIKDNIDTHDKMPNTAGSILLKNNFPKEDAFIVGQLRRAGAIIIGKTNLSEWANFRSTRSNSGWSSNGGQTRNPYNRLMSPCGSSSGTGSAISAGFATIGIGTETNGSISCPSAVNGIVGFKPTVGLWSRSGIIPISKTQDTAGPMTRSVKDAAILLGVCAGVDPRDEATADAQLQKDYLPYCKLDGLKGKRIAIDTSFLNLKTELGNQFGMAVEVLKNQGAVVIESNYRSIISRAGAQERDILLYEFKDGVNAYLEKTDIPYKNLQQLIEGNLAQENKAMPIFKQELFEQAQAKGGLTDEAYVNAIAKATSRYRFQIDSLMKAQNIDAFAGPTLGQSWLIDYVNGDKFNGPSSYGMAAVAGYPHMTVPMGMVNNLPVGICFIGGKYQEGKLISVAYSYEQNSKKRFKPTFQ
jgi:amidase